MHIFDDPLPAAVGMEELIRNNNKLTIDEVEEWIVSNDGIKGRLRFFETFARNNDFYMKVAKPLLSMRTTGSIDELSAVSSFSSITSSPRSTTGLKIQREYLFSGQARTSSTFGTSS